MGGGSLTPSLLFSFFLLHLNTNRRHPASPLSSSNRTLCSSVCVCVCVLLCPYKLDLPCCSLIGPGKQLVHYMAAPPVLLPEPITLAEGGADLPSLLELEAEPLFSGDPPPDELLRPRPLDPDP